MITTVTIDLNFPSDIRHGRLNLRDLVAEVEIQPITYRHHPILRHVASIEVEARFTAKLISSRRPNRSDDCVAPRDGKAVRHAALPGLVRKGRIWFDTNQVTCEITGGFQSGPIARNRVRDAREMDPCVCPASLATRSLAAIRRTSPNPDTQEVLQAGEF